MVSIAVSAAGDAWFSLTGRAVRLSATVKTQKGASELRLRAQMGVYFFWASVHVDTSHPVRVNTHQAVFCRAPERPQARETMARLSFIVAAAAAGVCSAFTAPARTPLALSTPVHVSSRCARARLNPAPHAIDAMPAWLCGLSPQFTELVDVCTGPRSDGRRSRPAPSTTRMLSWRRARRPRAV